MPRAHLVAFDGSVEDGSVFAGSREDFAEMLGNLLDNAAKGANREVRVRAARNGDALHIEVDDVVATKVRPAYLVMLVNRGRYLAAAHDLPGAREAFERALQLDPELPQAREGLDQLRLRATNTRSRE